MTITLLTSNYSYSQTIIDPLTDGGFETGATFAANGWTTANGAPTTRVWYCGTGQTGFTGARCGFIGNSTTNVGTNGAARTVHLYKSISIPVGATNIQLSFKYKQSATDYTYDFLTVHTSMATPVAGSVISGGLLTTVDPDDAGITYSTFTTVNTTIPSSLAGTTVNLVFTFNSDNVTPNGQGAIDDVSVTYTPAPNCTGTPTAGIVSASPGPVCATDNFNLSLSGFPTASGLTFQWQSSTDGITYTNIGPNSTGFTATESAATYYRSIVGCSFSGLSDTTDAYFQPFISTCYCSASATNTSTLFEKISNVTLGTINNNSSSFGGYENFTHLSTNLAKGVSHPMSVTLVNSYEFDQINVFIDYNRNGVFTDPGENVYTSPVNEGPYNFSFTVPAGTTDGPTRMRISLFDSSDGANLTSCGTSTYGQVEDYSINIVCPVLTAPSTANIAICENTTASLTATGGITGSTLNWYDDMSGGALQGSGSPFVTPVLTADVTYYVQQSVGSCNGPRTAATVTVSPVPTVNAGTDQTVCEGTDVTLTATGTGTFSWDNGIDQATPFTATTTTTYTVTVDNGACTSTDEVIVNVTPAPTADAGVDQTVCEGTDVTLTATGTGTFSWDNGVDQATPFTPTTSTTYTVTVDNGTCTSTDEVIVNVTPAPTADAGVDQTVCEGTDVTLTATGTGTFSWDNGVSQATPFTPTTTTTYTVTVDNGTCTNTDEITVTVVDAPTVNAGTDQTVCAGASVTLTATGTGTFGWNNGVSQATPFTATTTTTYTVTADNGTCTATDEVTVTVNQLPVATATANGIVLTASTGTSYQWINCGNGNTPISGATAQTFTPTANGTYSVTVTNGSGCSATSTCVTISTVGLEEYIDASISIFPNPTSGKVIVLMSSNKASVSVLDTQGKLLQTMDLENNGTVDLSAYQSGIYFLRVQTEIGSAIQRIVKN